MFGIPVFLPKVIPITHNTFSTTISTSNDDGTNAC